MLERTPKLEASALVALAGSIAQTRSPGQRLAHQPPPQVHFVSGAVCGGATSRAPLAVGCMRLLARDSVKRLERALANASVDLRSKLS